MPLHLTTSRGDQAARALCPGDPGRAALAARELLEGAREVTRSRGLLGFTGRHRGVPVTIQTTGMGGGSTAIVLTELVELGAEALVRAGTCGGLRADLPAGVARRGRRRRRRRRRGAGAGRPGGAAARRRPHRGARGGRGGESAARCAAGRW